MFILIRKKTILAAIAVLVIFTVCTMCLGYVDIDGTVFAKVAKKLPVYSVDRGGEKVVAISFDAAWGADKTRAIVELLNEYNAKGTFFLVGFWVEKYKNELAYLAGNGIEIGNHSNNHLHMNSLDKQKILNEITAVNDLVKNLTGVAPKFFRAPFGEYNNQLIESVAQLGMIGVQWDVDSLDWKGISGDEIAKRVNSKVKSGSIILCHNNSDHILEALPIILSTLTNQGYKFVTMSELVYANNYYIDAQGVQHSNL